VANSILFFGLLAVMPVMFYKGRHDKDSLYRKWGYAILLSLAVLSIYSIIDQREDARRNCDLGLESACRELDQIELYDDMNQ
jgi:hypothetical protein